MIWLLACVPQDPESVLLNACRGVPGVNVDAAGQALMSRSVLPEELALWRSDAPDYGPVITRIGLDGYGVVRANTSCALSTWEDDGAVLIRSEPDLSLLLGRWDESKVWEQPEQEREVHLTLVDTPDGPRVRLGLAAFRDEAFAARALADQGDFDGATEALRSLQERFPDPLIPIEVHLIEERRELAARPPIEPEEP